MYTDARSLPPDALLEYDLCIVGAGPAGLAIADRLADSGLRIALLVGGGEYPSVSGQRLVRGEVVGQDTWPLHCTRFRQLGGSGNRWGGQCVAMDPSDFEKRDWVPRSGWPIDHPILRTHFQRAADLLGLASAEFTPESWDLASTGFDMSATDFRNELIQISPTAMSFGPLFAHRLRTSSNVTAFLHASATDLRLTPGSSLVDQINVAASNGSRFAIRSRKVVLAAGAIENARLLLVSRGDHPAGLGNGHDQVGRYFMEHLHAPMGYVKLSDEAELQSRFYNIASVPAANAKVGGFLVPSPEARQTHRLLSTMILLRPAWDFVGQPFLTMPPWLTVGPERMYRMLRGLDRVADHTRTREIVSTRADEGRALLSQMHKVAMSGSRARSILSARRRAGQKVLAVLFRGEQLPNPLSRVTLSDQRDRFGYQMAKLDWRWTLEDEQSMVNWFDRLTMTFNQKGIGTVYPDNTDWRRHVTAGPHHMGTTRMSADPRHGVVDADCRVHSIRNLFVAGSSVFATSGYANPTYTLIGLALRLAEHIAHDFGAPVATASGGPLSSSRSSPEQP